MDYISFLGADAYLTPQDFEMLQKGVFRGMDARAEARKFSEDLRMVDWAYTALTSVGYAYGHLARPVLLFAIIAAKADIRYNQNVYGYSINIRESGTVRTNCYIDADGAGVVHISENFDEGGWDILSVHPGSIRLEDLLQALLKAQTV